MTNCCALHCTNNSKNGHSLIRFPKDEQMRRKWALKVRGNSDWIPTYHRICHVHFQETDWLKYRKSLKTSAVPSVSCQCHNCCVIFRKSRGVVPENYGSTEKFINAPFRSKQVRDWKYAKKVLERESLKKQIHAAEVELRVLCEALAWHDRVIQKELAFL